MGYKENYQRWLSREELSKIEKAELMAISDNEKEIEERFYKNAVMVGTTLKDYKGKEKTVVIPDGVMALEGPFLAWAENGVKEIFIPASVKKIARFTFSGMKSLERVVFETPNGWYYKDELISKSGVYRFNELAKPEKAAKYLTDLGSAVELLKM